MELQNIYRLIDAASSGIFQGHNPPMMGVLGQFSVTIRVTQILETGLESKLFEWVGCSSFIETHYWPLTLTPFVIGVINEMVPETQLETVDKVNTLYNGVMQGVFFASVGYGIINSLQNRCGWKTAYYTALLSGAVFTRLHQSNYISTPNFDFSTETLDYAKLAIEVYASDSVSMVLSRMIPFVIFKAVLYNRNDILTERQVSLIASRQMRRNGLYVNPLNHLVDSFNPKAVEAGTKFLCEEIYEKLSEEEKGFFQEMYPVDILYFALSKGVYLYTFGEKRSEQIPEFFKQETRKKIEELRMKTVEEDEGAWLEAHFTSYENYQKDIPADYQEVRNELAAQGHKESQQGMLVLKCWANVKN